MGLLRSSKSVICPVDEHCSQWARRYLDYCLCNSRDGVSLALGIISILSWVVAEIPQIITTYKHKSSRGLSIAFLFTWILGDFFNLFGCILEPATLPTQYYTAVLYTITTLLLTSQALYYGHIYPRLKCNKRRNEAKKRDQNYVDPEKVNTIVYSPSSPIPFPANSLNSPHGDLYFMSARSLSFGHSPSVVSFLSQKTPAANAAQDSIEEPLLGEVNSPQSQSPPKVKTMLCVVSLVTFIGFSNRNVAENSSTRGMVFKVGRRLLQATSAESSGIGSLLGWGMTAIYLCGRFPQIWLNSRRGHADGLNPLMFVFALVGNTTYVASILVESLEWSKIKPNLPWLVDAVGCVILDTLILFQFIYFRYRSKNVQKHTT